MTQEEKAKAYDEAIKRAKDALNDGTISNNTIAYLQDVFPVLKESEDERIRKDLIAFLEDIWYFGKNTNFDKWDKSDCSDWIDWLEKQGEQKPAWSEKDERNLQGIIDEIKANKNAAPDYDLATYDRFLSWLESLKDKFSPMNRSLKSDNNAKPNFNVSNLTKIKLNTYED